MSAPMRQRDTEARRRTQRGSISGICPACLSVSMFLCVALVSGARGDDISIIPRPVQMTVKSGTFTLTADTRIVTDDTELGSTLTDMLDPATGFNLAIDASDRSGNVIRLVRSLNGSLPAEGYTLESTADGVTITASDRAGLFYGMQTLRQLLPTDIFSRFAIQRAWTVPCASIVDYPRYRWRGMMLDCSRHFFPKEYIEKFIDLLAIHKMNSFHWHLTDDQGWRIQINGYPNLTVIGAWRKQTVLGHEGDTPEKFDGIAYGGFYSQDDIKEVVKFAAERFVNVVPEIEMPGHSAAAIASYPELGCVGAPKEVWCDWGVSNGVLNPSEHTIQFYQGVLKEVLKMFPSIYIHLGGDEVPVEVWKKDPRVQARMAELHLKDEAAMQHYLLGRMATFLESHGRRLVGWDEILSPELPPEAVVMSWHGVKGAALAEASGHDAVLAPESYTYFDHYQSRDHTFEPMAIGGYLPLRKVFNFEPGDNPRLLGAQGQIWTEYIPLPQNVQYMAFPRECALAEVVWSPKAGKNLDDFNRRLVTHLKRLDEMDVHYRVPKDSD